MTTKLATWKKKCPFIDECEEEIVESNFRTFCRKKTKMSTFVGYKNCPTYYRMLEEKQGKPPRRKPREWKKEKEE